MRARRFDFPIRTPEVSVKTLCGLGERPSAAQKAGRANKRVVAKAVMEGRVFREGFCLVAAFSSRDHFGKCQSTPENATHPKTQVIDRSQNLPFRVCCVSGVLWCPLRAEQRAPENATHPKTQILGTIDFLRFRVCCVFGCALFSSDHLHDQLS